MNPPAGSASAGTTFLANTLFVKLFCITIPEFKKPCFGNISRSKHIEQQLHGMCHWIEQCLTQLLKFQGILLCSTEYLIKIMTLYILVDVNIVKVNILY